MKKIPTTEEFLKDFNKEKGNIDKLYYDSYIISFAKEFAKLHVEAQVKEIVEKVKMKDLNENNELNVNEDDSNFEWYVVDKNSILEAYPLTNVI